MVTPSWAQELLVAVGDVDRRVLRIRVAGEVGELGARLGLSRPFGQTHSSERARLCCYTQRLVRFGNDVETLDVEAVGVESSDGKRKKT